jgi:uncharacterized protein YcnI
MTFYRAATRAAIACASLFLLIPAAYPHITLATRQARIDTSYKAVFRVPHGCHGSATVKLRVQIPQGVIGVKPQPKTGWAINIIKGQYDRPHVLYGTRVTSGVKEVDWTGGPLPDDYYDEFVLVGYLSGSLEPDTVLYFPVVQECEEGVQRWTHIPAGGKTRIVEDNAGTPAPGVLLLPKAP